MFVLTEAMSVLDDLCPDLNPIPHDDPKCNVEVVLKRRRWGIDLILRMLKKGDNPVRHRALQVREALEDEIKHLPATGNRQTTRSY